MAHNERTQINNKQIAKMIRASAKRVIATTDLNTSTRKGNKELDFIVKRMANAQTLTPADAEQLGKALGEQIVQLSQSLGRKSLDHGVLHQLAVKGQVPSLDGSQTDSQKAPSAKAAAQRETPASERKGKAQTKVDTATSDAATSDLDTTPANVDADSGTSTDDTNTDMKAKPVSDKEADDAEPAVEVETSSDVSDDSEDDISSEDET
ncbi:MAG: hypothetical protein VKL39_07750, partial [Leptolyngbyaceae bacterium]|nr:hypothetical protein [Leptolyngbyaceae bacterium]